VAAKQPHFSPKQIAGALQVSESSVKRWCDAGSIPVIRTVGGHRRITLDGLQNFLRETNRTLINPDVLGLPNLSLGRQTSIPGADDPLRSEFRDALASGDEEKCCQLIQQRMEHGHTRTETAEDLITDAMHGIGESWDQHQLDVYQERRSCEIAQRLIFRLRAELPPPAADAPIAIGGAPAGDPYQLPSLMVELALREIGWNAINLGYNLPLESFVQAAHDYSPEMVWLSVSSIADPAMFVAAENKLAACLGDDIPLLIGGRALNDEIRPRLRYTAHCDSLRHLTELASMMRLNLHRPNLST
jgi:excisionase family DNA binding protein